MSFTAQTPVQETDKVTPDMGDAPQHRRSGQLRRIGGRVLALVVFCSHGGQSLPPA